MALQSSCTLMKLYYTLRLSPSESWLLSQVMAAENVMDFSVLAEI
jgi:hypothetical protein